MGCITRKVHAPPSTPPDLSHLQHNKPFQTPLEIMPKFVYAKSIEFNRLARGSALCFTKAPLLLPSKIR